MPVAKHHRATPLLRILERLGWQHDPELRTVRCLDGQGRRTRVLVHLNAAGVSITAPEPGPLQLTVLQSVQLRKALRDAVCSLEQLGGSEPLFPSAKLRRFKPTPPPPVRSPDTRQRVEIRSPARPSVAEIATRLVAAPTPDPEVDDEPAERD